MRFFRRLLFGPFTIIRWVLFLSMPWILFVAVIVYRYFQIFPDDREEAYVPMVETFLMLNKALVLQSPLLGMGLELKTIFRKGFRIVHFICVMTLVLGLLAETIYFMCQAYTNFNVEVS